MYKGITKTRTQVNEDKDGYYAMVQCPYCHKTTKVTKNAREKKCIHFEDFQELMDNPDSEHIGCVETKFVKNGSPYEDIPEHLDGMLEIGDQIRLIAKDAKGEIVSDGPISTEDFLNMCKGEK
jgi:hypothetical protein